MRTRTVVALLIGLLAASCTSSETETSVAPVVSEIAPGAESSVSEPIRIGAIHPVSGGLALDGQALRAGAQMAVDDINSGGGIQALGGRKLELVTADSEGKPDVGQTEAVRMIDGGVVAIIGSYQSAVSVNIATLAEREKIPYVVDIAVSNALINPESRYTFRIQPNADEFGAGSADLLAAIMQDAGVSFRRIGYLYEQSEFGSSIFNSFKARAEELGFEIVLALPYNAFQITDFTTELAQINASGAEILAATGYRRDGILLLNELSVLKPTNIKMVFGPAHGVVGIEAVIDEIGTATENVIGGKYQVNTQNERLADIQQRFVDLFGSALSVRTMPVEAVFAYQAIEVIAAGLEASASTDRQALRDAISALSIDDALVYSAGPLEFTESGENANAAPMLVQGLGGKWLNVYPEGIADSKPAVPGVPWSQ